MNHLNERELATVLAALRVAQGPGSTYFLGMLHFSDRVPPLTNDEIDALCERLDVEEE